MVAKTSKRLHTPVGETIQRTIQICSDDGTSFPAKVYTGVNASEDPELREALIEGTLNQVESPLGDDRSYSPAVPVAYHSEEHELFVLVIPGALRHREFDYRAALLEQLGSHDGVVPGYMRRFDVVFDPRRLQELEQQKSSMSQDTDGESVGAESDDADGDLKARLDQKDQELQQLHNQIEELEAKLDADTDAGSQRSAELDERAAELEELVEELEQRAQQLDERAAKLDARDDQLQQVADRVERDSRRVDEARQSLDQKRAELEHRRQKLEDRERKLQVRELNLEQQQLEKSKHGSEGADSRESTQVVTDSQFIEVVDAVEEDQGASEADHPPPAPSSGRPEPTAPSMMSYDPEEFYEQFDEIASSDTSRFVETTEDLVVIGYKVDESEAAAFTEEQPRFLFQLHRVDEVPVVALTLAAFNEDEECTSAVATALADRTEEEREVLDQIADELHVHLVLYDEDDARITSWEAGAPIGDNIKWAREQLEDWRDDDGDDDRLDEAIDAVTEGEVQLVGSMRHPFDTNSFVDFSGASDVKLAAGIVDYWSQPEQTEYLIGNRGFSLQQFRRIQQRVVRQALHWGLVMGEDLREVALQRSIVSDRTQLVERLLSNFAELCVGLRPNDLDPIEQWENWDKLLSLAEAEDITPDPDVLELAEVSLKRAEEYELATTDEAVPAGAKPDETLSSIDVTTSTVSHRCDATELTYYLPQSQQPDGFSELMEQDRDDLEAALDDAGRRVEAAQVLLERFGPDAVDVVLDVVEEMNDAEVAAVARFVEARADGLEAALMRMLDSAGPCATFIAARALAAIESTAAIPRLLEAVQDPQRRGDDAKLVECLALFGDKLVPPLSQQLKKSPKDEHLLEVLAALEKVREGTIEELSGDQNQQLQKAAGRARKLV